MLTVAYRQRSIPTRRPFSSLHSFSFSTSRKLRSARGQSPSLSPRSPADCDSPSGLFLDCLHWTSIRLTRPPLGRSHARTPPLSLSSSLLQLSCSDAGQGGQRTNNPPSPSPPVAIEWLPRGSRDAPPPFCPPKHRVDGTIAPGGRRWNRPRALAPSKNPSLVLGRFPRHKVTE